MSCREESERTASVDNVRLVLIMSWHGDFVIEEEAVYVEANRMLENEYNNLPWFTIPSLKLKYLSTSVSTW